MNSFLLLCDMISFFFGRIEDTKKTFRNYMTILLYSQCANSALHKPYIAWFPWFLSLAQQDGILLVEPTKLMRKSCSNHVSSSTKNGSLRARSNAVTVASKIVHRFASSTHPARTRAWRARACPRRAPSDAQQRSRSNIIANVLPR